MMAFCVEYVLSRFVHGLLPGFLLWAVCLEAQPDLHTRERSISIIRKGVELHDAEKYEEALAEFQKVQRNDSNYYLASVELLNTYVAQKKNEEGVALCDHLLTLKNDYTPTILVYKGDFLDQQEKYGEAMKVYQEGAREYPLNHAFPYQMGVCLLNQQKYDEAFSCFVKVLRINPFHTASHLQLGLMARRNNNTVAAMLAYQFSIVCDGSSKRAQGVISDLEKLSKIELEADTVLAMKVFENENDFTELESIVKSKVALGEKYKSKTKLPYDLVKQMQLLIENIGKYKEVKGFYNEFYGGYFTALQNEKLFEPYVYSSLRGMEIEKVSKWLQKNKSKANRFKLWSYNYLCRTLANYPENLDGKLVSVPHWFSGNFILAAGMQSNQEQSEGYWNFYYKNGIKKSEGAFVKGKKNKTWKYYRPSGELQEMSEYEQDKEVYYKGFYANSNPSVELWLVNDKIAGTKKTYFTNGNLASSTEYKSGEINGMQSFYHRNGSLRYTIKNEKDNLNGDLVEYFDNGRIYQKVKLVNNLREGPGQFFWNNAGNTVESEGTYTKGKATGEWKLYYRSGKLHKQMNYNAGGELEGPLKEFHENGKIQTDESYSDGKLNGLSREYTDEGALWQEFVYKNGKLVEYRAYKKDGSKICDNKINGKNFALTLYHPNGAKRREGQVSEGELDGVWKDYSSFGVLERETNYKESKYEGVYKEYHPNGKVKRERNYSAGTENGYYRSYHINGLPETEGMIVNGSNEGCWKNYYPDGSLESNSYYSGDNISGWNEFFDVSGRLSSENLYSEECLVKVVYHDTAGAVLQNIDLPGGSGLIERKTREGKVIYKKQFVKDFAEGPSFTFYPDGKPESEMEFKKGKREGRAVTYNCLGSLSSEASYFNNEKNGKETEYFLNGNVRSEYHYENGDYHGSCSSYFENGNVFREVRYEQGESEGESAVYDEAGELVYTRFFHNDLLVSYSYKDTKGQLLKPMELGPGDNTLQCYFRNGKKSFDATYTNGDLNGKRTIYHSNGSVLDETDFYFGVIHGLSKDYYANGNLRASSRYYYSRLEGLCETYYENGKRRSEESFKQGLEHGWSRFYDASGKLVRSVLYYNGNPILVN